MSSPLRAGLLLISILLVPVLLAGCSSRDDLPTNCPSVGLLPDAADLGRYRSTGRDLTDLELSARIVAVPALCSKGPDGAVKTTLRVAAILERGPAATGRAAEVDAIVSVVDGTTLLDQQDYVMSGAFPANLDRVTLTTDEIMLVVPNTRANPASRKRVLIGFRLTPDELAFNRKHGVR